MGNSYLVSIVCPTYNSAKFIAQTIQSVQAQTYPNFELIVVDDCSRDNTAEVVNSFLQDRRIKLHKMPINSGAAIARNIAISEARGEFIAFLDSDDLWDEKKLKLQIQFMLSANAPFSYTEFLLINELGDTVGHSQTLAKDVTYNDLLKHCIIQNSTVIYDVRSCGKVYCPEIRKRQDFGLFLSLLKKTRKAHLALDNSGSALTLASYRLRTNSVSSNKFKNIPMQWSIYRDFERLGLLSSFYYMTNWFFYSGMKNLQRKFPNRPMMDRN